MKLIISLFFAFIAITFAIEEEPLSLDEWYTRIKEKHKTFTQDDPFYSQLLYINNNKWCIENNIDWYNNKKTSLNFAEAMILIYGAGIGCLNNKDNTWKKMIESLMIYYHNNTKHSDIDCFKLELDTFEPRSYALWNFNSKNMDMDTSTCNSVVDNAGFAEHTSRIEEIFGSLPELTCNAVDGQKLKRILLTIVVLSSEGEDRYRTFGISELVKEIRKLLDDAFTCVKGKKITHGGQQVNHIGTTRTQAPLANSGHGQRSSQNHQNTVSGNSRNPRYCYMVHTNQPIIYTGQRIYESNGYQYLWINNAWCRF